MIRTPGGRERDYSTPESEGRALLSLCGGLVIPQYQGRVIAIRYISITLPL